MCCHGNSTQIQYDFTYSEATNLKLTAATPAGITIASLVNAASDGRRIKYAAVVRFDKKPTEQELMAAVFEMQSTGVMYAKWLV